MEFEELINKIMKWVWAGLGVLSFGGAVIAAICGIMYLGFKAEEDPKDKKSNAR